MSTVPNSFKDKSEITLEFQLEFTRIGGNTYPHKEKLRKMKCNWNPVIRVWERELGFSDEELEWVAQNGLIVEKIINLNTKKLFITSIGLISDEIAKPITCIGYIYGLEPPRKFKRTKQGSEGHLQRFILSDQSGSIQCVSWDLTGFAILKNEICVAIENGYLKKREDELELHCNNHTTLKLVYMPNIHVSQQIAKQNFTEWITQDVIQISSLKSKKNQKLKGIITDFLDIKEYFICPNCSSGIENKKTCKNCTAEIIPTKRLVITIVIDDGSDAIKATFFGGIGEEFLELLPEEIDEIKNMLPIERLNSMTIANRVNVIIGQEIILNGKVEKNKFSDLTEIIVKTFHYPIIGNLP